MKRMLLVFLAMILIGATPSTQPSYYVTRRDLAGVYVRFEQTLRAHPPAPGQLATLNKTFDTAAMRFLTGDRTQAAKIINGLADSLLPQDQQTDEQRAVQSLRVRVDPSVATSGNTDSLSIRIEPMYAIAPGKFATLQLIIRPAGGGSPVISLPIDDVLTPSMTHLPLSHDVPAGAYDIAIRGSAREYPAGKWFVCDQDLNQVRVANQKRLEAIKPASPQLENALRAVRTRNAMLTPNPGEVDSAKFLMNPLLLKAEVNAEIEQLSQHLDPFTGRTGEYWRPFYGGALAVPARVYVPASLNKDDSVPLVIALHGAGGDESMFFQGYGAGLIKDLADEHGFIVVAPSTYWVLPNPGAFDAIVETVASEYKIDRTKIYLIGHSMGAMAAQSVASRHAGKIAAVCLIAGGSAFPQSAAFPRTLMFVAELDPIFPVERMKQIGQDADNQKLPVELRVAKDLGHAAITDLRLRDAIDFLLDHHLDH